MVIIISRIEEILHISPTWDHLTWYRRAVGYYRIAVGYYRVIAQERLKSKNTNQELFRTSKITKIGPIATENDTNEKRQNF